MLAGLPSEGVRIFFGFVFPMSDFKCIRDERKLKVNATNVAAFKIRPNDLVPPTVLTSLLTRLK